MRKALCYIILLSMTLHCAGRLGVLSYVYKQRHEIAYTIGLISEIPIALCSSDYDFNKGLTVVEQDHGDQSVPPAIAQASEINLFLQSDPVCWSPVYKTLRTDWTTSVLSGKYDSPADVIFHPPATA